MRAVALLIALLIASPAVASDVENPLLGVWKLESFYLEVKATGEKTKVFGEKPNGYIIFTPEKRMMVVLTAEQRTKPNTDEDRIAAFRSMAAYSGIYRSTATSGSQRSTCRGTRRGHAPIRCASSRSTEMS